MIARVLFTTISFLTLATAGCELIDDLIPPGGGHHPSPGSPPTPPGGACTAIGCSDQLTVRVRPDGGLFPSGAHTVLVTPQGQEPRRCDFVFAQSAGSTVAPVAKCSAGLSVWIFQKQHCTTTQSGQSASRTCTPVPGEYEEQITVNGTPASVRLTQTVDGKSILDQDLAPTYKESRPNGPTCEPLCKQASVELTF